MTRFTSSLIALLVCAPALAGCASDGGLFANSNAQKKPAVASNAPGKAGEKAGEVANLPTDIESSVRQAQEARLAGRYDEAIRTLSQLMMVASDDHRVVGEYGKTLAQNGRAPEAVQFLTRAVALQPSDWSYYSALGVAYDQVGNQDAARTAYEQALKLRPGDAAILNNYALSRMLAKDPDGARALMARAEKAGGASDPKIARNIELVEKLAPPALKTAADTTPAEHAPTAMTTPVSSETLAAPSAPAKSQVVMQPVPADPLAGPAKTASRAPAPLPAHAAKAAKVAAPSPKPEIREAHSDSDKPAATAKVEAAKPDTKTAKADAKPVKPQVADAKTAKPDSKDVKAADAKADGKAPAKPAAKNGIPALRQTASAY